MILALLLAAGAYALPRALTPQAAPRLSLPPAPTLTPRDSAPDSRVITLAGETWYALQLGAFDSADAARSLADAYRARGAGGLIWQQDVCRVLAAAYETRADAQAVQTRLLGQHGVETVVTDVRWPEVTLRVTGQKAQLDALEDAYDAFPRLIRHLSGLSAALDQGETAAAQAMDALKSERETASALAGRLQALFGKEGHPAVKDVRNMLEGVTAALDAALGAPSATRLGAQIKYCQLFCLCRMAAHAQGLTR